MASQTSGSCLYFLPSLFGHFGVLAPLASCLYIYLILPCLMHTSASSVMDQIVRGRRQHLQVLTIHHAIPCNSNVATNSTEGEEAAATGGEEEAVAEGEAAVGPEGGNATVSAKAPASMSTLRGLVRAAHKKHRAMMKRPLPFKQHR